MSAPTVPRRSRLPILSAVGAAIVLLLALGMYLYDHSRRDVISSGVRIDGVGVGGLHESAALRKIQQELITRLEQPVTIRSGSRTWTLPAREAGLRIAAQNMVAQALT